MTLIMQDWTPPLASSINIASGIPPESMECLEKRLGSLKIKDRAACLFVLYRLWSHLNPRFFGIFTFVVLDWKRISKRFVGIICSVSTLLEADIGPFEVLNVGRLLEYWLKSGVTLNVYFKLAVAYGSGESILSLGQVWSRPASKYLNK